MTYTKTIHNIETGQIMIIEITEHQFRCDKLGLPVSTPEADVNAAWVVFQAELSAERSTESLRESKVLQALADLKNIDMSNVQTVLDKVTDPNAKLLLTKLIQVVRLLVIHTLQGDD